MVPVVNATRRFKKVKRRDITGDATRLLPQVNPYKFLNVEGSPQPWPTFESDIRQLAANLGMEYEKIAYPKLMHQVFERSAGVS
ncbi:hypothetical protein CaCOL14_011238 [Colletotrichum acutatum]